MSENVAVPTVLLVDEKFHTLNKELKLYARNSKNDVKYFTDWREKATQLYNHVSEFLLEEIDGSYLPNFFLNQLPRGRLDEIQTLLNTYREGKLDNSNHGFLYFAAGEQLKRRLVCYWCVNTWMREMKNAKPEHWKNRTSPKSQFLHVFGQQGQVQSSQLSLNRRGHAVHPRSTTDAGGGSKCTEVGFRKQTGHVSLCISGNLDIDYRVFIRNVPDESHYQPIFDQLTEINDYLISADGLKKHNIVYSDKFIDSYTGFIEFRDISEEDFHKINDVLHYDSKKFSNSNVTFLEGIFYDANENAQELIYMPHDFTKNQIFGFSSCIQPVSPQLGLFLFVKSGEKVEDDPYFTAVGGPKLSAALSKGLRWNKNGNLYRFIPDSFNQTGADLTTTSSVDLSDWLIDSPLLKQIRRIQPNITFPKIRTTLHSIKGYSIENANDSGQKIEIEPLRESARLKTKPRSFLFKINGFNLSKTVGRILMNKVDKGVREAIWARDLDSTDFTSGAVLVQIHDGLVHGLPVELNLWVHDDKYHATTKIIFPENSSKKNQFQGFSSDDGCKISLIQDRQEIAKIFLEHLRSQLCQMLGMSIGGVQNQLFIDEKPVFSEIIKSIHARKGLTGPITVYGEWLSLYRNFLALDMQCFGRENLAENSFGVRLRSMGTHRSIGDKEWVPDGEHIVQLNKAWNLLLTNKPLHTYGLSVNDERLIVTNHGTFFKSNQTIDELSSISRESKPRFLHHIAPNPQSHLQFLVDLMDCDPAGGDASEYENLRVSHQLRPTDKGRLLGSAKHSGVVVHHHWANVSGDMNGVLEAKRSFYVTHQAGEGPLTCLDLVLASNENGTNQALILRRHHQSGQIDTLNLGRWIDDGGRMIPYRPAWWAKANLSDIEQQHRILQGISEVFGAQYQTPNYVRAHDWHFMVRDTLRAFHLLSGQFQKPQINTLSELRSAYSKQWPEPLRKYLMGGGRYFGAPERRNGDALGGLLDDLAGLREPGLKRAIIGAVLRWTWCPRG